MRGSDYLLQENKMKAFFYFRELMSRTYSIAFQPRGWNRPCNRKKIATRLTGLSSTSGLKVLHVIGPLQFLILDL